MTKDRILSAHSTKDHNRCCIIGDLHSKQNGNDSPNAQAVGPIKNLQGPNHDMNESDAAKSRKNYWYTQ